MKVEISHVLDLLAKKSAEYKADWDFKLNCPVEPSWLEIGQRAAGRWEAAIDIFDCVSRLHHQYIENPNQCSLWLH